MRIKNVEMEIVTFDSADVIATSNPLAWFQVSESLYSKGTFDPAEVKWTWGTGSQALKVNDAIPTVGDYYLLSSTGSGYTGEAVTVGHGTLEITGATAITDAETVGTELETLADIVEWLFVNALQP